MNSTNDTENGYRILLVEDDARLAELIREYLEQHGFYVATEARGDKAMARFFSEHPDLVILDVMLPGRDGFELCRDLRPHFSGPVLMLTARDEDVDQVVGLELGADDYVTKPVPPRVLLARVRALLRRNSPPGVITTEQASEMKKERCFGSFYICYTSRHARIGETHLDLTTHEFELLWLLVSQAGEVLSRDAILEQLRGIGHDGLDRSVDLRISRLRKKLGDDPNHPRIIKTVRGKGYLFVADAWC